MKSQTYHLISQHKDSFEGELALAVVEKVLKTGSEEVDDHDVVVSLNSKPVDVRDADYITKGDKKSEIRSLKLAVEKSIIPTGLCVYYETSPD